VSEGSYLEVVLDGPLSEKPVPGGLFDDPEALPPTLTEISSAIREAATDDRIEGIYLQIGALAGGMGAMQEIRGALEAFQEAGKPCVAYSASGYMNKSYYLASACDMVGLSPDGVMFVGGMSFDVSYYAETLEKIGVEPEFEHVGDFKSATETFERTGPSEPAALAYNEMLDSLHPQMVDAVAASRGVDAAQVNAWIDRPVLPPAMAQERGMVDFLAYPDGVSRNLTALRAGDELPAFDNFDGDEADVTPLDEYLKGLRTAGKGTAAVVVVPARPCPFCPLREPSARSSSPSPRPYRPPSSPASGPAT